MGLYRCDFDLGVIKGLVPALVSGFKLPLLFVLSTAICIPALYVSNCLAGPRLYLHDTTRLLLLATSCNAVVVASLTPVGLFFTLTSPRSGYEFLVLMHFGVFVSAGIISLGAVILIFRTAASNLKRDSQNRLLLTWGLLYGVVLAQMSWTLRPWIGTWAVPYAPFRPIEGTLFSALWGLVQ
jgi:hypothetical protein